VQVMSWGNIVQRRLARKGLRGQEPDGAARQQLWRIARSPMAPAIATPSSTAPIAIASAIRSHLSVSLHAASMN